MLWRANQHLAAVHMSLSGTPWAPAPGANVFMCVSESLCIRVWAHTKGHSAIVCWVQCCQTQQLGGEKGKKKWQKADRCHFNLHSVYHAKKILVQVEILTSGNPPRFKVWIERTQRFENFLELQNRIIQPTVLELLGISQWVASLVPIIWCSHGVTLTTIFYKLKTL